MWRYLKSPFPTHDRRRSGKNDDFDAESVAHAAFAERHTGTLRSRDGIVESLCVLRVCRKTAFQARRIALEIIQTTIVCAPDRLQDALGQMTRMQLIRTSAVWWPDLTAYREVEEAYRSNPWRGDVWNCMKRSPTCMT